MSGRRANPYRVKLHYSYTVPELAAALAVHKNTVRHWQRKGLEPIDKSRPLLFQGETVRAFLIRRSKAGKCPCPPATVYCLRCRQPRAPAFRLVEYLPLKPGSGNLRAMCEACASVMYRRVREAEIAQVMPGCHVQRAQGRVSLTRQRSPSVNCDEKQRG